MPGCSGVKIFMGSSTGSLLVAEDESLERVLENGRRRVAIHAEDEARLRERLALVKNGADVKMHPSGATRRLRSARPSESSRWRARPAAASTSCMSPPATKSRSSPPTRTW